MSAETDCIEYAHSVVNGTRPSGRWIYAACKRYLSDLERTDISMDWDECEGLFAFFGRLNLINEHSAEPFVLGGWQRWALSNMWGWKLGDGSRRISNAILQVARGNGKTTLMAGLALYDLQSGEGKRVHVVANRKEQAAILLDTAKTMTRKLGSDDIEVRQYSIERRAHDCVFTALPAKASSLDGLTPSLWIADEAAEYRDRNVVAKLTSAMAKRKSALGVIISTPASNPDGIYQEKISHAEAVLTGEVEDDATAAMLYGIDGADSLDDEECWVKANPGMEYGQPGAKRLKRHWLQAKSTPMGRNEFARYICCRMTDYQGGWLDMSLYPEAEEIDWAALRNRPAWAGLDLSKSFDLTALVVVVPMDDGRLAMRGKYWWPGEQIAQRELDYRLPARNWAANGFLKLTPGLRIDYESVLDELLALREEFQLQSVAYDAWGSQYFAESADQKHIPMQLYSQGYATMGPGCNLFQQYWLSRKLAIGNDPVFRNACRCAIAVSDSNGNIKVDKRKNRVVVDPLVAAIMAVHSWGGETRSVYEDL
jgi:phage terminase large subunit-like protein